jgi:hypothetical protein
MNRRQFLTRQAVVLGAIACSRDLPAGPAPAGRVRIAAESSSLVEGASLQLTIEGEADPGAVTWSTGNPGIATVDANGVVTGIGAGVVRITASTGLGEASRLLVVEAASRWLRRTFDAAGPAVLTHLYDAREGVLARNGRAIGWEDLVAGRRAEPLDGGMHIDAKTSLLAPPGGFLFPPETGLGDLDPSGTGFVLISTTNAEVPAEGLQPYALVAARDRADAGSIGLRMTAGERLGAVAASPVLESDVPSGTRDDDRTCLVLEISGDRREQTFQVARRSVAHSFSDALPEYLPAVSRTVGIGRTPFASGAGVKVAAVARFRGAASAGQIQVLNEYGERRHRVPRADAGLVNIVFEGNSIVEGSSVLSPQWNPETRAHDLPPGDRMRDSFPARVMGALGAGHVGCNVGTSGLSIARLRERLAWNVARRVSALAKRNVVFLYEFTNSFSSVSTEGLGERLFADWTAYVADVRRACENAVPDVRIAIATMLPTPTEGNEERLALNEMLRSAAGAPWDAVVDWGAHPRMGPYGANHDPELYDNSQVPGPWNFHPTVLGYRLLAEQALPVIRDLAR